MLRPRWDPVVRKDVYEIKLGYPARVPEDPRMRSLVVIDALAEVIEWHQRAPSRCTMVHGDFVALWSNDPPDAEFLAALESAFSVGRAEVVTFATRCNGGTRPPPCAWRSPSPAGGGVIHALSARYARAASV